MLDRGADTPIPPVGARRRPGAAVERVDSDPNALAVPAVRAVEAFEEGQANPVAVFAQEEARAHQRVVSELSSGRRWAIAAMVVGLVSAGAALVAVSSSTAKSVIPIAVALLGVGVSVALAGRTRRSRRPLSGAEPAAAELTRILDRLAAQRSAARLGAIGRSSGDG